MNKEPKHFQSKQVGGVYNAYCVWDVMYNYEQTVLPIWSVITSAPS